MTDTADTNQVNSIVISLQITTNFQPMATLPVCIVYVLTRPNTAIDEL